MRVLKGSTTIRFAEFEFEPEKKVLWRQGEIVPLPLKAAELLSILIENRGQVVPKEELIGKVWSDSFVEDAVLTQNIYLLRKTLKANGTGNLIRNVPRRGYVFETQTPANQTVIERSVIERVEIEEIEETLHPVKKPAGQTKAVTGGRYVLSRGVILVSAAAVVFVVGLYFYAGGESTPRSASRAAAPPLKLNPRAGAPGLKSLAILEFESADALFADTFADDLAVRLGSMNKFSVVPRTLVREYQKQRAVLRTDFVLSGSVEIDGELYKANIELTEIANDAVVRFETFEYKDLVQLQDAVASRAAQELIGRIPDSERIEIAQRLPTNAAAYEHLQSARALWRRRVDGSAYAARGIEMDAGLAPAYALLANIKATGGMKGSQPAKEAERLLNKAFEADENLADAHAVHAFIKIFHYRDWVGAEASLKKALALEPDNVNAHHWLAVYLSIHRRLDEAKAEMRKALEIDPTHPTLLADMGQLYYFSADNATATDYCRKALAVDPNHGFAAQYLSVINSREETTRQKLMSEVRNMTRQNSFTLPYLNVDPRYNEVRDQPAFKAILKDMGLMN